MRWLRRDLINTLREDDSLIRRGMSAQNRGPMFLSCALSIAEVVREISKLEDENLVGIVLVARFVKITIKGFRELIVQEFVHGFAIFNLNKYMER